MQLPGWAVFVQRLRTWRIWHREMSCVVRRLVGMICFISSRFIILATMAEGGPVGLNARLMEEFDRLNRQRFGGAIEGHSVRFSRTSCRTHGSINFRRKSIRISMPMYEQHGWQAVVNTLLHEMTHALLHRQGAHGRHNKAFWGEFGRRGGVRDRLEVKPRAAFVYACSTCGAEFHRARRLRNPARYSCRRCDRKYNPLHGLYLKRDEKQGARDSVSADV